jgi:hypothetical protein
MASEQPACPPPVEDHAAHEAQVATFDSGDGTWSQSNEWASIGNEEQAASAGAVGTSIMGGRTQTEAERPSTSSRSRRAPAQQQGPVERRTESRNFVADQQASQNQLDLTATSGRTTQSPRASQRVSAEPPDAHRPLSAGSSFLERPMTAKKAPPNAPVVAPEGKKRTSRVAPPDNLPAQRGAARSSVHLYKQGDDGSDDDVNVVQETLAHTDAPAQAHGALVNDMYKAKEAAEQLTRKGSQSGDGALHIEGGINLGRAQRKKRSSIARADVGQLREAVESLVQGVTPLARSMENLQV